MRLIHHRSLEATPYTMNGNFHQKLRKKHVDTNDEALTLGGGYFEVPQDAAVSSESPRYVVSGLGCRHTAVGRRWSRSDSIRKCYWCLKN